MNIDTRPTKQEIIEKCRQFLNNQEIDILCQDNLPTQEQLQKENCALELIGVWDKCKIFIKKHIFKSLTICYIILRDIGSIDNGINVSKKMASKTYTHFKFFSEEIYNYGQKTLTTHPIIFHIGSTPLQDNPQRKETGYYQTEVAIVSSSSMVGISSLSHLG